MIVEFLVCKVAQHLDSKRLENIVKQKIESVQPYLDSMVLQDSNYFCPLETSDLQKSAIINTTIGSGLLIWQTPYARAQYYGEQFDHSKQRNPNACAKWFEAAKARWHSKWVRFINEMLKNS